MKHQHHDFTIKIASCIRGFECALHNIVSVKYNSLTFKLILIIFLVLSLSLSLSQPLFAANKETTYSTLKAVFLERFTRFIDWPNSSALSNPKQSFTIGVFGNKEFAIQLADIYKTQKILNKNVIVQEIFTPDEILGCQLLFVSNNTTYQLSEIIDIAKRNTVLTISDTPGYTQKGVLINFFSTGSNIRFEINETAIKEAGFQISYKLLSVAEIVEPLKK